MLAKFCEDVVQFLHDTYSDKYTFECVLESSISSPDRVTLTIHHSEYYSHVLHPSYMEGIFISYCTEEFIEERGMFLWQKELVDAIEGS